MAKNKKRSGFSKDDLVKLILSVNENANIFYISGFSSSDDFFARSNMKQKTELFHFMEKNNYIVGGKNENMIFVCYKDGSYFIMDFLKNEWINITNTPKTHLDGIKRWFLRDSLATISECQICYRDIVKFENGRVFNECYRVCGRCGYMQCIECVYNLKKNDNASECIHCKHKYEVEIPFWSDDHSIFLRNLHQNMSTFLNYKQVSMDEFKRWMSINQPT